jgi:4-aminobutyrate aminotransferase/(S)-3-amino-2-methylpropionate transaminase
MDMWQASKGEALHTQTFLGHPVGCAAALAMIGLIREGLPERCQERGDALRRGLVDRGYEVQGRGLMLGVRLEGTSLAIARGLQRRGYIALPSGQRAEVLCLTPPASLTDAQITGFLDALDSAAEEVVG